MNRRSFIVAGIAIGSAVMAGGALTGCALPTEVAPRKTDVAVIHGTPFTVDVKMIRNAGAPLPTGTLIRGTRLQMGRIRAKVTTGRGLRGPRVTYGV